jgi:hypothetical protein
MHDGDPTDPPRLPPASPGDDADPLDPADLGRFAVRSEFAMVRVRPKGWWRR